MALEERCGVGRSPFLEDVGRGSADEVYRVNDARYGIFACAEDGELDGKDAVVETAILVGENEGIPCGEDVGGAEGVHEGSGEIFRFKALLDGEELGVDFLVVLPDVVGEAELVDGVESWKKRGGEILVLRGCRPVVGIGKQGEDDLEGVVAELFQRQEKSLYALLGCRGDILVTDDAETVGREDEVELRNGMEHRLRCSDDAAVMQERCVVGVCADASHRFGGNERVGKPLLRLHEVEADLVEKELFAGYLFEGVGDIAFEGVII